MILVELLSTKASQHAAGSEHGQLLKPKEIRQIIRQIGRIPAQRATSYKIIKTYSLRRK